ncbi:hypothetical protein D3C83_32660 [compost metagenome]
MVNPEADRAVTAALGPGTGVTGKPAERAAATSSAPGSEIAGVPASDTSASDWPAPRSASTWPAARRSLCSWTGISRLVMP